MSTPPSHHEHVPNQKALFVDPHSTTTTTTGTCTTHPNHDTPTSALTMTSPGAQQEPPPTTTTTTTNPTLFYQTMKERVKARREKEQEATVRLQVLVHRLEAALQAETKRRTHCMQQLQKEQDARLEQLEGRIMEKIQEHEQRTEQRLEQLNSRLVALEDSWKGQLELVSSNHEIEELRNQLQGFENSLEIERRARLSREAKLLQRLEETILESTTQWKEERQNRLDHLQNLQDRIEHHDSLLDRNVAAIQATFQQELNLLKQEVSQEIMERENTDQDIAAALNTYVQQLQNSLNLVSSM